MLTSKEQIKELVGGSFDASNDALLDSLAAAASAYVVSRIGYDPEASATVDTLDGMGGAVIVLSRPLVTDFTKLTVNGQDVPAAPDTVQSGYVVDKELGIVYLRGYCAWRGARNVEARYTAGYVTVPADLAMAATEIATLRYKTRSNIGIQSKTLANETIVFTDKDATAFARNVMALYQRPACP